MTPVEGLAIQSCYTSARFIAAHLRKYKEHCEAEGCEPWIPGEVLDAADRMTGVLDLHRPKPLPEPREFIEGYDDVPDEDHGAGRIGR